MQECAHKAGSSTNAEWPQKRPLVTYHFEFSQHEGGNGSCVASWSLLIQYHYLFTADARVAWCGLIKCLFSQVTRPPFSILPSSPCSATAEHSTALGLSLGLHFALDPREQDSLAIHRQLGRTHHPPVHVRRSHCAPDVAQGFGPLCETGERSKSSLRPSIITGGGARELGTTIILPFTRPHPALPSQTEIQDESGWKLVHGDVFRAPPRPMLLSVLAGSGVQLLVMMFVTLLFACLGFLSPANRGSLMTCALAMYACSGVFAGKSPRPPLLCVCVCVCAHPLLLPPAPP